MMITMVNTMLRKMSMMVMVQAVMIVSRRMTRSRRKRTNRTIEEMMNGTTQKYDYQ